jgi:hypothetical protein
VSAVIIIVVKSDGKIFWLLKLETHKLISWVNDLFCSNLKTQAKHLLHFIGYPHG